MRFVCRLNAKERMHVFIRTIYIYEYMLYVHGHGCTSRGHMYAGVHVCVHLRMILCIYVHICVHFSRSCIDVKVCIVSKTMSTMVFGTYLLNDNVFGPSLYVNMQGPGAKWPQKHSQGSTTMAFSIPPVLGLRARM